MWFGLHFPFSPCFLLLLPRLISFERHWTSSGSCMPSSSLLLHLPFLCLSSGLFFVHFLTLFIQYSLRREVFLDSISVLPYPRIYHSLPRLMLVLLLLFVCLFIFFLLACHLSLLNYEFVQVSYVCVSFIHLLVYSLTCIYWAPAYVIEANEFYSFKPNVFFTQGTDKNMPRILEPNTKRIPSRFWASLGINLQRRALKGDYFCMCILALKILGSVGIDSIS